MLNTKGLIRSILTGVWFLEPRAADGYLLVALKILKGEKVQDEIETPQKAYVVSSDGYAIEYDENIPDTVEHNSVAIIPMMGPIVKYDSWCETGTQTRAQQLIDAANDPRIVGAICLFDTPGGESMACEVMHKAIKTARQNIPVYGVVDGMCASAGMWIASACEKIYMTGSTSWIGSIGTYISIADFSEYYAKEGIKVRDIYATKSTEKNADYRDALQGKDEKMKSRVLDPINELFLQTVRNGRPNLDEAKTLTGQLFLSADGIKYGLADEYGDVNTAINDMLLKSKNEKELAKLSGKKKLSMQEASDVQRILKSMGIPVQIQMPVAQVLEAEDGRKIYVYAEEGEDPVGKRCVYADDAGEPTEENVEDGDTVLSDGRIATVSTHDDGMSYIDAISEKEGEPAPDEEVPASKTKKPVAKAKTKAKAKSDEDEDEDEASDVASMLEAFGEKLLNSVDEKISGLKSEIGSPGNTPRATNGGRGHTPKEEVPQGKLSAIQRRMQEITEKNKGK